MNKLIIIGIVLVSMSCLASSKTITVTVKEGFNGQDHDRPVSLTVDDGILVEDLIREALTKFYLIGLPEHVRLENALMKKYNPKKTLEAAGIKDGSVVTLKFWSRVEDLKANTLMRLLPVGGV